MKESHHQRFDVEDNDVFSVGSMHKGHGGLGMLAFLVVLVFVAIRFVGEHQMIEEHPPDAQLAFAVIASWFSAGFLLVTGGVISAMLDFGWYDAMRRRMALVLLAVWLVLVGLSAYWCHSTVWALRDAADPETSPDRLHRLVHFNRISSNYRIDDRLAANSGTGPEDLRRLYNRADKAVLGNLAHNPSTPEDVLMALAESYDVWILYHLLNHPYLPESVLARLGENPEAEVRARASNYRRQQ